MVVSSSALSVASASVATLVFGGSKQNVQELAMPQSPVWDTAQIGALWFTIPHPVRYFISGNLGNVCFFSCERVVSYCLLSLTGSLSALLENHKDTASFFLGYIIHIPAQHFLHALLVYGLESINTPTKYKNTLFGMYATLVTAAVGSTALNAAFLSMGVPKTLAFVGTLGLFSILNYFAIGYIVGKARQEADAGKKDQQSLPDRVVTKGKRLPIRKAAFVRGGANAQGIMTQRDWIRSTGRPVTLGKAQTLLESSVAEL